MRVYKFAKNVGELNDALGAQKFVGKSSALRFKFGVLLGIDLLLGNFHGCQNIFFAAHRRVDRLLSRMISPSLMPITVNGFVNGGAATDVFRIALKQQAFSEKIVKPLFLLFAVFDANGLVVIGSEKPQRRFVLFRF